MGTNIRAHVIISGRVQGVFYRMSTQRAAREQGVNGWVKNRYDGTVEAVFEGDREAVAAMIKWCWNGPPGARVQNVEVVEEDYTGTFKAFKVAF
jgi:acylphosphatase